MTTGRTGGRANGRRTAKKKALKKAKSKLPQITTLHCTDCGCDFDISREDHDLLCEAKTCSVCEMVFTRRLRTDAYGKFVCADHFTEELEGCDGFGSEPDDEVELEEEDGDY